MFSCLKPKDPFLIYDLFLSLARVVAMSVVNATENVTIAIFIMTIVILKVLRELWLSLYFMAKDFFWWHPYLSLIIVLGDSLVKLQMQLCFFKLLLYKNNEDTLLGSHATCYTTKWVLEGTACFHLCHTVSIHISSGKTKKKSDLQKHCVCFEGIDAFYWRNFPLVLFSLEEKNSPPIPSHHSIKLFVIIGYILPRVFLNRNACQRESFWCWDRNGGKCPTGTLLSVQSQEA